MSDQIYERFENYIIKLNNTESITHFKDNDDVTYMLEHVSPEKGLEYLNYIQTLTPLTKKQIISYCIKNDQFGGGKKYTYDFITTSPSNFRYLLHAHLILSHAKSLGKNEIKIAEVGCGYGGLCIALIELSTIYNIIISKYYLTDLPGISKLQQLYLSNFNFNIPLEFHSAYTYGSNINDDNLFLVSNYCFSEIEHNHQMQYIAKLFPKVSHGFMVWNRIIVYNFGFTIKEELEYPLTGAWNGNQNKYIYF